MLTLHNDTLLILLVNRLGKLKEYTLVTLHPKDPNGNDLAGVNRLGSNKQRLTTTADYNCKV